MTKRIIWCQRSQRASLNSQMVDGSAQIAKTITSRAEKNATDAKKLDQRRILLASQSTCWKMMCQKITKLEANSSVASSQRPINQSNWKLTLAWSSTKRLVKFNCKIVLKWHLLELHQWLTNSSQLNMHKSLQVTGYARDATTTTSPSKTIAICATLLTKQATRCPLSSTIAPKRSLKLPWFKVPQTTTLYQSWAGPTHLPILS